MAESVIVQSLYFAASYIGIVAVLYFGLNWLTKGFIYQYLKVRASRGNKVLVTIYGVAEDYYRHGHFESDVLIFKDKDGKKIMVPNMTNDYITNKLGVHSVEYDIVHKTVLPPQHARAEDAADLKNHRPDPKIIDEIINRIILSPKVKDNFKLFVIIALVLCILLAGGALYYGYANAEQLSALQTQGIII